MPAGKIANLIKVGSRKVALKNIYSDFGRKTYSTKLAPRKKKSSGSRGLHEVFLLLKFLEFRLKLQVFWASKTKNGTPAPNYWLWHRSVTPTTPVIPRLLGVQKANGLCAWNSKTDSGLLLGGTWATGSPDVGWPIIPFSHFPAGVGVAVQTGGAHGHAPFPKAKSYRPAPVILLSVFDRRRTFIGWRPQAQNRPVLPNRSPLGSFCKSLCGVPFLWCTASQFTYKFKTGGQAVD